MSKEHTTQNTGKAERIVKTMLTPAEIEALNAQAARLGMTTPAMLSRAVIAEVERKNPEQITA